jgi:hypothetical protein
VTNATLPVKLPFASPGIAFLLSAGCFLLNGIARQ